MARTKDQLSPLYRRLPHGPNGMEREEVARNQRSRLYGAMIESVARNGYQRTTVAHVIALAGVSRRAFYELFANKEDCFLATYDIVVARAPQARRSRPGRPSGAGRTACTPPARRCSSGIARARRGRGWCSSTRSASGRGRANGCSWPSCVFERIVATAFSLAPETSRSRS